MKALYAAPETWVVPVCLESVLCESGDNIPTVGGEGFDIWEEGVFNIL